MKKREEPVWEKPRGGGTPRPINEQITWKTREQLPPDQRRNLGRRDNRGWQPKGGVKPLQPVDRSLGEATMVSLGIRPSAPIPRVNPHVNYMEVNVELEKLNDVRQALEGTSEKFEQYEKRLVLIVTRLDRAEERIGALVSQLEKLEPMLQNFATLVARMETILSHNEVRRR